MDAIKLLADVLFYMNNTNNTTNTPNTANMATTPLPPSENRINILLPNLFKSFFAPEPPINQHYARAGHESDRWICAWLNLSESAAERFRALDFNYNPAVWASEAPNDRFRILCDWSSWIFVWDDLFDEEDGELSQEAELAKLAAEVLMESMQSPFTPEGLDERFGPPSEKRSKTKTLIAAHQDFYARFSACASLEHREWYISSMRDFVANEIAQVLSPSIDPNRSVADILESRRMSIGVEPTFALICFCHSIPRPPKHPVIERLGRISTDFTLMTNDLVSYRKEEAEAFTHNLVATLRLQNYSAQAAFDHVGVLLDDLHREFEATVAELPEGEDVQRYVKVCKDVPIGNLYWSFRTSRYFGALEKREEVRRTRVLDVAEMPGYLWERGKGLRGNQDRVGLEGIEVGLG